MLVQCIKQAFLPGAGHNPYLRPLLLQVAQHFGYPFHRFCTPLSLECRRLFVIDSPYLFFRGFPMLPISYCLADYILPGSPFIDIAVLRRKMQPVCCHHLFPYLCMNRHAIEQHPIHIKKIPFSHSHTFLRPIPFIVFIPICAIFVYFSFE